MALDPEEYAELVLRCVESVPRGRVTTYGAIAEVVGAVVGGGGPRQVGAVMSAHGGPVPWWRVVRADGTPPECHDGEAHQRHLEEGTPLRPSGRVDLRTAFWRPPAPPAARAPSGRSRPEA
jgi:alkylated DNA nucleotide flippase Atl1